MQKASHVYHINLTPNTINKCKKNTGYSQNSNYEGWNFNSGNYLFTTDTK